MSPSCKCSLIDLDDRTVGIDRYDMQFLPVAAAPPGDKGDGNFITNSICAKMKDQSLESRRFEDYRTGNKGVQQGFGMAVAGGMPLAPFSP